MASVHEIQFEGHTIKYDSKAVHSWKWQKVLAKGGSGAYDAVDAILCGKSDEVAELFEDDADKMMQLLTAIGSVSKESKN